MSKIYTLTDYDSLAGEFDNIRQSGSLLIKELKKRFRSDSRILSIGCGTGQYEAILNSSFNVTGLDMSFGMLTIARKRISSCINGNMVAMPFRDCTFDGIYFMQSLHHAGANFDISHNERSRVRRSALKEAWRVLRKGPLVIIQRDPSQNQAVWFWKYFPEALQKKLVIQPPVADLITWLKDLGLSRVTAAPIADPMVKGFYDAGAPLNPGFRKSFSEFSYLTDDEMDAGVKNLRKAISDGSAQEEIKICKERFDKLGGTVFVVSGLKE